MTAVRASRCEHSRHGHHHQTSPRPDPRRDAGPRGSAACAGALQGVCVLAGGQGVDRRGKGPGAKGEQAISIHPEGKKWRVKYRIAGKQLSRTFDRKADARTFDAEVTRKRQLGPVLAAELERDTMTLDQFVRGPWRTHAATLAGPTRAKYAWALEKHLAELLDEPLISIDVARLAEHQRKVAADPSEEVEPLSPVELERLIAGFSGRDRAIALLAGHFGLRPIEIHSAPWAALHQLTFYGRALAYEAHGKPHAGDRGPRGHGTRAEGVAA